MDRDIILLLIGAVVGAVVGLLCNETYKRVQESRAATSAISRPMQRLSQAQSLPWAALAYFEDAGRLDQLYLPELLNGRRPIPLLWDGRQLDDAVPPVGDDWIVISNPERRTLPFDPQVIANRTSAGARLWDGEIVYITDDQRAGAHLHTLGCGVANYYSYVTRAERIQRELLKSPHNRDDRLLASLLPSLTTNLAESPQPLSLAAATVCLFETPNGPVVLLGTRSNEVVNAMGTSCVLPTFGMESSVTTGSSSEFGAMFFNFAKEFIEEVFGRDEADHASESRLLTPDAVFRRKVGQTLLEQFYSGKAELTVLGVGIEATDGTLTYALRATFDDPGFLDYVIRHEREHWESLGGSGPRLRFIPVNDHDQLTRLGSLSSMSATSIFALDRTLSQGKRAGW